MLAVHRESCIRLAELFVGVSAAGECNYLVAEVCGSELGEECTDVAAVADTVDIVVGATAESIEIAAGEVVSQW
jgi:hypothetical protein